MHINELCFTYNESWIVTHYMCNIYMKSLYMHINGMGCTCNELWTTIHHMRNTSHLYAEHNSFIRGTWLIYVWDKIHINSGINSDTRVICGILLICMCETTHSYEGHDSFTLGYGSFTCETCGILRIQMCATTHPYVWTSESAVTVHSYVKHVWYCAFKCVRQLIHTCGPQNLAIFATAVALLEECGDKVSQTHAHTSTHTQSRTRTHTHTYTHTHICMRTARVWWQGDKVFHIPSNETCILPKEPCILSKETHILFKRLTILNGIGLSVLMTESVSDSKSAT